MKIGDNISVNNSIDTATASAEKASDDAFKEILENLKDSQDEEELRSVSEDFEAIFINMMFKSMRGSSDQEGSYIEKSNARSMFESMYDDELSKVISKSGGFGIADMIYKSLSKDLENNSDNEDTDIKSIDLKG